MLYPMQVASMAESDEQMRMEIARSLRTFLHRKYQRDYLWPLMILSYFDPLL